VHYDAIDSSVLGLTLKAGECMGVRCEFLRQKLECYEAIEARVLGLVDNAHPAALNFSIMR
jgi:hypothetical protein